MNDKQFQKSDKHWMAVMKPVREKQISEKILHGFAASVIRKIEGAGEQPKQKPWQVWALAPVLAVMVLASTLVLRTPVLPGILDADTSMLEELELAEALVSETQSDSIQEELNVLSELGVLDEYEDLELLGSDALLLDQDTELSRFKASSSIA